MPHDDPEDRSILSRAAPPPTGSWHYGSGVDQVADVYLPSGPATRPVILVHGGFWRPGYDRMHLRPLAAALAEAGHPVLSLEYPRIPGDPDATVNDLRVALVCLALVPPEAWPETPAVIVGHSAGGHLALLMAGDQAAGLAACVALAPVADLVLGERMALDGDGVRAFLGDPADMRPDLDPARGTPLIPVIVLHGGDDTLVPIAQARAYRDAVGSATVRELPGVGHFALIDPLTPAFDELLTALAPAGIE